MSLRVLCFITCSLLGACTTAGSAGEPTTGGTSPALRAPNEADLTSAGAWKLTSAIGTDGKPITALFASGVAFRLQFSDGRVYAHGGCNRLSGDYTLAGNRLRAALPMGTKMACEAAKMQADTALRNLLMQTFTAELTSEEPGKLLLRGERGEALSFDAIPLTP